MQRREFISRLVAMGLTAAAGVAFAEDAPAPASKLPRRALKPGGPELSIIGFGGLLLRGMEQEQADVLIGAPRRPDLSAPVVRSRATGYPRQVRDR